MEGTPSRPPTGLATNSLSLERRCCLQGAAWPRRVTSSLQQGQRPGSLRRSWISTRQVSLTPRRLCYQKGTFWPKIKVWLRHKLLLGISLGPSAVSSNSDLLPLLID